MVYLKPRKESASESEPDLSLVTEASNPSQNSYDVSKGKEVDGFGI